MLHTSIAGVGQDAVFARKELSVLYAVVQCVGARKARPAMWINTFTVASTIYDTLTQQCA